MGIHSGLRALTPPWRVVRFHRTECEASVVLRAPLVPLALAGFLLAAAVRPTPFALTGAAFSASVLLLTLAWSVTMAVRTTTRRILRFTAVQVGDHLEELLQLENRSPLPVIYAEVIDHSGMPGYAAHGIRVVDPRRTQAWRLHTTCTRRGVYPLGRWEVRFGDPLGVFEARQVYRHDQEVTVCPPLALLPTRRFSLRRTLGDRLTLRQPLPSNTTIAMSTRPYATGDPASRIHWRTSARHDEIFVRQFDPEASSVVWLILDLDQTVHVGEGDSSSLESMIIAGATLASQLLMDHQAVGLLCGGDASGIVSPRPGPEHLWTILRALATAAPSQTPLGSRLAQAAAVTTARDSAVILTPSLDPSWLEQATALGARTHGGAAAWLLDPASFGGRGEAAAMAWLLNERGIPADVLRQADIQPIWGAFGPLRRWEFRTLATGRVVPSRTPRPVSAHG
jgi:uncharacterized protein (DUF58 family)